MPVIAMVCAEKQAHDKTDQLFIYRFEVPGGESRVVVANLTNVYEPGQIVAVAQPGTQLPEAEIVPRKVFGIDSSGMALGPVDATPGDDVTDRFEADAPRRRFKLVFEIEGEDHYPERLEKALRKALGKGEGSLVGHEVVGAAAEET